MPVEGLVFDNMGIIDLDFLNDLSGGDPDYICDVMDIFLSTVPSEIENLQLIINEGTDWEAIYKQSHKLKSSLGIIKIGNIYELMTQVEANAMTDKDIEKARDDMNVIISTFKEAHPILLEEKEKYEQKRTR